MAAPLSTTPLHAGMKARVSRITQSGSHSRRLVEMGLVVGTEFEVLKVAPLGDPIEIGLRGYRLCLRRKEAEFLEVEAVG